MKICAVVVTYNRKILLKECLEALLRQEAELDKILIIDNASTDGSKSYIKKFGILDDQVIDYKMMKANLGGAGGFYEGIKIAKKEGFDWIWIMDDDTICEIDTLTNLVRGVETLGNPSYVASCVRSVNNEPMNVPTVNETTTDNGYSDWYMYLKEGLVSIERATFVSIMFNSKAIEKVGLPCKDFFLWGDDSEYTYRLTKLFGKGYLVGNSWVTHKRANSKYIDISFEQDTNRIPNYHYYYRNKLATIYYYKGLIKYLYTKIAYFNFALRLKKNKMWLKKFTAINKGLFESIAFKHKVKHFIDSQIDI